MEYQNCIQYRYLLLQMQRHLYLSVIIIVSIASYSTTYTSIPIETTINVPNPLVQSGKFKGAVVISSFYSFSVSQT
jgi:hypothetical protein